MRHAGVFTPASLWLWLLKASCCDEETDVGSTTMRWGAQSAALRLGGIGPSSQQPSLSSLVLPVVSIVMPAGTAPPMIPISGKCQRPVTDLLWRPEVCGWRLDLHQFGFSIF